LIGVGGGAYGATKASFRLLSKSIGGRYARERIRCNSVHPGIISTNLTEGFLENSPDAPNRLIATIPAGRVGAPEDIANCVLFLASDESGFVTGAEFVVDGGKSAQ
jgi:NAD(P)-dependent dehydrogenase (short-subunit alcohol dehydrogenase family)